MARLFSIIVLLSLLFFILFPGNSFAADESCQGKPVTGLQEIGVVKKLLSFSQHARPGYCGVKPTKIVMHTTWGIEDADGLWEYFEKDPENRGGASTHFVIGKDGRTLQMAELYTENAEITWAVAYYNDDSISIELGHRADYASKGEAPQAQYTAAIRLVQKLMDIYDIPIGNIEANVINRGNAPGEGQINKSSMGIFGHYQLSPVGSLRRSDPGQNFLRDFREDLKRNPSTPSNPDDSLITYPGSRQTKSPCVITKVGEPGVSPSPPPECEEDSGIRPPPDGRPPNESCAKPSEYPSDLRRALADEFEIGMIEFDDEHMRAVWEMFHCFSGTKFASFVTGTTIINGTGPTFGTIEMSCQGPGNCNIWITQMPGRMSTFTFILTHEFGHVIGASNLREDTHWTEHENAFGREGGISLYGRAGLTCNGDPEPAEDYADMIAYFLHPEAGETTPACDPDKHPPNPFFELNKYPLHLEVAEKILL